MSMDSCPYCRTIFEPDDDIIPCPACGTRHHTDCFEENGGCTVFGCTQAPSDEATIRVNAEDFRTQVPLPVTEAQQHGVLNLSAAPTAPAALSPPPPPLPAGTVPPPPPPGPAARPTPTLSFAGYAPPQLQLNRLPGGYEARKSRMVFVLLAIFLGAFGGHNFYAGYIRKAVIQLCLTLFTCFACFIISWMWAILEACIINCDDDGVAFV